MAAEPEETQGQEQSTQSNLRHARGGQAQGGQAPNEPDKKPWPLSWILIIILTYIALQTAYFLFFAR